MQFLLFMCECGFKYDDDDDNTERHIKKLAEYGKKRRGRRKCELILFNGIV